MAFISDSELIPYLTLEERLPAILDTLSLFLGFFVVSTVRILLCSVAVIGSAFTMAQVCKSDAVSAL